MQVTASCPAKINEFLAVGTRDGRGYHPIRTLFQAVGLFDTLTISDKTKEDSFVCDRDLPERNTVTKAWTLVKEFAHLPPLSVRLEKNIPAQSGLGGGSSDAGGFLRAISSFTSHKMKTSDLMEIAAAVGTDVPFFLVGGRAKGEGYGEILTALDDEPQKWIVLAQPEVECSTVEMYSRLDAVKPYPFHEFAASPYNDFERVAPSECIELIGQLKELGSTNAGLTGSGSAVFGIFRSEVAARLASDQLKAPWSAAVPTISREESLRS